jgi:hypothetical protein
MKRLFLLFPLFSFQCEAPIENEPVPNQCTTCYKEIVWFNNGFDTVLIERTVAPMYKCERWGLNDNYAPIPNSEFWSRYKCE